MGQNRKAERSQALLNVNLIALFAFWIVVTLAGGASRADAMSQPVVRLAAVAVIAFSIVQFRTEHWRRVWPLLIFVLMGALLMAAQLIPLPHSFWASLPGRQIYVDAVASGGLPQVARPLSLAPDLTLASLLGLLPALATALLLGLLDERQYRLLPLLILAAAALSAVAGLLQIAGTLPYHYRVVNSGFPVGFLANRNHQALLLALSLPLLACWAAEPQKDESVRRVRIWVALCAAAAVIPFLLVVGSRGGLVAGGVGALLALAVIAGVRRRGTGWSWRGIAITAIPVVLAIAAVVAALAFSRDEALERIIEGEGTESRLDLLPQLMQIAGDFFPAGAGFGTFDALYRSYETYQMLQPQYLNHAHNDLIEIAIEGGLAALLLALALGCWVVFETFKVWRRRVFSHLDLVARAASAALLLVLIGSVVDYPVRTPFFAVLTILLIGMLHVANLSPATGSRRSEQPNGVGTPGSVG